MSAIEIKGLKVTACHGVLECEKSSPQLFGFDLRLECDTEAAAADDDINKTCDYAGACALVSDYCKKHSFNLIERLAYGSAFLLAEKYKNLSAAQVTVHKPQAPVGLPVSDVTFTARVERNTVILSLGSSEGDRQKNIKGAIAALSNVRGITVKNTSPIIESQPYGGVAKNPFLNCAVKIECLLSPSALLSEIHKIEADFMRVRDRRWDDRTLDIDIIFFGNKIIEEEGLCIPHPDYKNRPFVIEPIKKIAPGLVCPLTHKRIEDM